MSLLKLCHRRGANLNIKGPTGCTPFSLAIENGHTDILEYLLNYGVSPNARDGKGQTPMHIAAYRNDIDIICRIRESGGNVNTKDKLGRTPLIVAAAKGHNEAINLLLELGADLNAVDNLEQTALVHAKLEDHFDLNDRLESLGGMDLRPYMRNPQTTLEEQKKSIPENLSEFLMRGNNLPLIDSPNGKKLRDFCKEQGVSPKRVPPTAMQTITSKSDLNSPQKASINPSSRSTMMQPLGRISHDNSPSKNRNTTSGVDRALTLSDVNLMTIGEKERLNTKEELTGPAKLAQTRSPPRFGLGGKVILSK